MSGVAEGVAGLALSAVSLSDSRAQLLAQSSGLLHPLTTVTISPILALREQIPIAASEVFNSKQYDS